MNAHLTFMMDIAQTVGMALLTLYGWWMKRQMARAETIQAMKSEISTLKTELSLLKQQQRYAPTHQDLASMHEKMNDLAGAIRQFSGALEGLTRSVDRVETYLLERKS